MLLNARVGGNNAHTMDVVTSLKDALVKITTDQTCRGGLPNEEEGKSVACTISREK